MLDRLRGVLRSDPAVRECRLCGTTVDGAACCPACGSREIASYRL